MARVGKISKAKGVELVADWLFSGWTRKEIGQELAKLGGVSESGADKWIKAARPLVKQRQAEAERIRARESEAAIIESAKKLNLTRERILEEYAKIGFADVREILTVDGGMKQTSEWDEKTAGAIAGIESYDEKHRETGEILGTVRKVKMWDKKAALDSICKVLGYNAPEKAEIDHTTNGQNIHTTFVIKRRSDRDQAGD